MPEKAQGFILRRKLELQEIAWGKVLDLLCSRFKMNCKGGIAALQALFGRFTRPFSLGWFLSNELCEQENKIAVAICEVHAADALELSYERLVGYGPLKGNYCLRAIIEPALRFREFGAPGKVSARIELGLFGKTLSLRSPLQVLMASLLFWGLSLAVAMVFAGLLIYSLAVFFEFLKAPFDITIYALEDGSVGLSLLCFLVAVSAICGRAIGNLVRLLRPQHETDPLAIARPRRGWSVLSGLLRPR